MDWGWVSTGVVGVAGIFGTLWQGKRSREAQTANLKDSLDTATENLKLGIDAENKRAHQAEKRRIYAAYLSATTEMSAAAFSHRPYASKGDDAARKDAEARCDNARDVIRAIVSEAMLIAPAELRELLRQYVARVCDICYGDS